MVKRRGFPSLGDLVICKVKKINPNSAEVNLEEYTKSGMIHISEVFSGWVKKITDHVKLNDTVVAKVMKVNQRDGYIALSVKKVDKRQEKEKLKEFNMDKKAEKMLEMAGKKMDKTLSQSYDEVGYSLQENFGSLFKGFKKSMKSPDVLETRGIPNKWVSVISEIAEKNIEQKEFEFKENISIHTLDPDGVDKIKKTLVDIEKMGIEVTYISAPVYMLKYRSKDPKKGQKTFQENIKKIIKSKNGLNIEMMK